MPKKEDSEELMAGGTEDKGTEQTKKEEEEDPDDVLKPKQSSLLSDIDSDDEVCSRMGSMSAQAFRVVRSNKMPKNLR